jgi:membrane-bound lytic murein transglycosylase D
MCVYGEKRPMTKVLLRTLVLSSALFTMACAGMQRQPTIDEKTPVHKEQAYKPDPKYGEIPLIMDSRTQTWINYFTGRGRRHMKRYLERSGRYLPYMKDVFRERGMPEELAYLQFVESGFSSHAYSHAAAVGYWQFIRGTGKRYNLKIDRYVDERRDPVLSTQAAASYFHSLYSLFGDWFLSMAAYNWGENRVKRAVMRYKTRDYYELLRRRKMPRETRNYVPKLMAAIAIAKNPAKYGFTDIQYQEKIDFDEIQVSKSISLHKLAKTINVDYKELQKLNPRYRTDYVPMYKDRKGYIRVPKGMKLVATAGVESSYTSKPTMYPSGTVPYRVRRGDTLSEIAQKHGTSVRRLLSINNLSRRSLLRIGQRLRVPEYGSRRVSRSSSKKTRTYAPGEFYKVRKGDTLSEISEKFNVSQSRLRRWNRIGRFLRVGQRLRVKPAAAKTVAKAPVKSANGYHVVRRGENLTVIAQKYGTTVSMLRRLNNLGRKSLLKVGQRIKVTDNLDSSRRGGKKYHVVRRGDTLSGIAQRYKVSIGRIAKANKLRSRSTLHAGKKLLIP